MFDFELSKISNALENCLNTIKSTKNKAVQSQKYECSAKLREIEKQVKNMTNHLDDYLAPQHALTPEGKQFYNELFNYCIISNWENVPEKFIARLMERKIKFNQQIDFNDKNCEFLLRLNDKFAQEENSIREFYEYARFAISRKKDDDCLEDLNDGNLIIKCYTETKCYHSTGGNSNSINSFFQFQIPLSNLINASPALLNETMPDYDLFRNLPVDFIEKEFCPLFTLLITGGILAWQDLLNISQVSIDLHINYQFPSFNLTV